VAYCASKMRGLRGFSISRGFQFPLAQATKNCCGDFL